MSFQYAGRYGPEAVTDRDGNAQLGVPIPVLDAAGAVLATLYINSTRTTQAANPVLSDAATGNLTFYADPGDYQLSTPSGLIPITVPMDPRDLPAHVAAADPHGDRADAGSKFIPLTQRGATNGVATLDSGGKIPTVQLPPLSINDTFTVASQAAMLALTAQRGDAAVRTDLSPAETFMLTTDDPTQLANWVQITTAGAVTSVFGRTGAVALAKADVTATGLGAVDVGAESVVVHGSTAGTARPAGATVVHWIGSVAPTNAATNDEWSDTTNKLVKRWTGTVWDVFGSGAYQPILTDPATITYNADGTVATVTVQGVTTTYTYNADGTVATEARAGVTRTYTYTAGNLTSVA